MKALPHNDSHETCPPCAHVRWIQVVAAFDTGGGRSVIRLLRGREPFDAHVCRGGMPRTAARALLLRAVAKNGNLGITALSGAAIHQTIRRRADRAGVRPRSSRQVGRALSPVYLVDADALAKAADGIGCRSVEADVSDCSPKHCWKGEGAALAVGGTDGALGTIYGAPRIAPVVPLNL